MALKHYIGVATIAGALLSPAQAGVLAGKVNGVTERATEPLPGVVVMVQGTVRGAASDVRGDYRIIAIPPGEYTVTFSLVGYQRLIRENVVVTEQETTIVNVVLNPAPVPMDQVVVTASKHRQSLEEVPVSLAVLDASSIRQRNALTIDDALRYIPGVNMTGFQVNIRGSSGYSRGAGSRVLMLLDGIPFITGDTGELNFESIPVDQVDRIEVVKGASSALYGSNALGGVINIITKDLPDQPQTTVRVYGGAYNRPSYDQWRWTDRIHTMNGQIFSHAYKTGDLGVGISFSRQLDEGYRENDYRRRYNLYLKVKEDASPSTSITATAGLLDQYGGQFLYWRNLDSALIPPAVQDKDNIRSTRYFLSSQVVSVLTPDVVLTVKGLWYHNLWGFETIHGYGRSESQADDFRLEGLTTILLDDRNTLTSGIEANADAVGGDMFDARTIGGFAVYAQDEAKIATNLTVTLGARYDYQSVGLTTPGGQLNPKLALSYIPTEGTTLRASFGMGYRVPSVAEAFITATVSNLVTIPNKDLRPEKSRSYEVGINQRIWDFGLLDLAAFRTDYDDLIEAGLIVNGQDVQIQWRNITDARVQGVEASLKLGVRGTLGSLQFSAGYTYVFPEDLTKHDVLKYRPRHIFYGNLLGRIWDLSAGVDVRYLSRTDAVDVELVQVGIVPDGDERKQIIVADARMGMDFVLLGAPMTATVLLNNVFQYNYVELIGNIMPPRTLILTLEARL